MTGTANPNPEAGESESPAAHSNGLDTEAVVLKNMHNGDKGDVEIGKGKGDGPGYDEWGTSSTVDACGLSKSSIGEDVAPTLSKFKIATSNVIPQEEAPEQIREESHHGAFRETWYASKAVTNRALERTKEIFSAGEGVKRSSPKAKRKNSTGDISRPKTGFFERSNSQESISGAKDQVVVKAERPKTYFFSRKTHSSQSIMFDPNEDMESMQGIQGASHDKAREKLKGKSKFGMKKRPERKDGDIKEEGNKTEGPSKEHKIVETGETEEADEFSNVDIGLSSPGENAEEMTTAQAIALREKKMSLAFSEADQPTGFVFTPDKKGFAFDSLFLLKQPKCEFDRPIKVYMCEMEKSHNKVISAVSQVLYTIEFEYYSFIWRIKRHYLNFVSLHSSLLFLKAQRKLKCHLPNLPTNAKHMVVTVDRRALLHVYLKALVDTPELLEREEVLRFLELSPFSLVPPLGPKYYEGIIQKKSGGRTFNLSCFKTFTIATWKKSWLIIKDGFIAYAKISPVRLRSVLLFDSGSTLLSGREMTGDKRGIIFRNKHRKLRLKCNNDNQFAEIVQCVRDILPKSEWVKQHPFSSFAPVRGSTKVATFADGVDYFHAVADAIMLAKEQILIEDWWLSPEIFLKRPPHENEDFRLDRLLRKKADEGIRIFVIVYKEVELALTINSAYSKSVLARAHRNISVMRHPDHPPNGTWLWAHHEKMVVIDQTIAFIGGLDLCFGRFDDPSHSLTDYYAPASEIVAKGPEKVGRLRVKILRAEGLAAKDVSGRSDPYCVVAVGDNHFKTKTIEQQLNPVWNETFNFALRDKNDHVRITLYDYDRFTNDDFLGYTKIPLDSLRSEKAEEFVRPLIAIPGESNIKGNIFVELLYDDLSEVVDCNVLPTKPYWIGKDYSNPVVKDFFNLSDPFEDSIDRWETPRMPWHDIACCMIGSAARDVARHFIERFNFVKDNKAKKEKKIPFLLPKGPYQEWEGEQYKFKFAPENSASCQILRSSGTWSLGIPTDSSIHSAYIHAINNAQHFVYIENQFFVTSLPEDGVINKVGEVIVNRIVQAYKEKQKFKVVVAMPLLPAFEGEIGGKNAAAIQAVMHWQYRTISRGGNSLLEKLAALVPHPEDYIQFYGLRTYAEMPTKFVTEQIYIHSKLMIVDDRVAIIGSANINDRSLRGSRDSEICVRIEDTELIDSKMDGQFFRVGKVCHDFRKRVFAEHGGLDVDDPILVDPIHDDFLVHNWHEVAVHNSHVFESVFLCIPNNTVRSYKDLDRWRSEEFQTKMLSKFESGEVNVRNSLKEIKGHLVVWPILFLDKEYLGPLVGDREYLVPQKTFQ
eukprot:Nk52_evm48s2039 gene=Nk52_evmTU48s2039